MPRGSTCDPESVGGVDWVWGANTAGQLNREQDQVFAPFKPEGINGEDVKFTAVSAGAYVSAALDEHGRVWTWGDSDRGQLGLGDSQARSVHSQVAIPDGVGISFIDAANLALFAIDNTGQVWAWGHKSIRGDGNDSLDALTPVRVAMPRP
jgi:alpha-tubulin suppressor-like RCC1 family protein